MDQFFLSKCDELTTLSSDIEIKRTLFYNSFDDYKDNLLKFLFLEIKKTLDNCNKSSIGRITNLIKVYNLDETVDPNNLILEYELNENDKLHEMDLIYINQSYVFISELINNQKCSVQLTNMNHTIEINNSIYFVCNYKKYYRMYQSIINSKRTLLRNLFMPNQKLTRLNKSKLKSDFWNQEQRDVLASVIKPTENKKIHVIDGLKNTGKSTLIMGLIQNYLSRFNNIKLLITSSNKKLLTHLANRIISQKTILIPQNKWIMIVGDINYVDKSLHHFLISSYVDKYMKVLQYIQTKLQQLESDNIDNTPIVVDIINKLDELPFEPYSHRKTTISELLQEVDHDKEKLHDIILQCQLIIDKWLNHNYINNRLLNACSIVISTICSSGCPSMDIYKNNIIMIDDAEQASELETLIPLQDSTEQILLFGNSSKIEKNTLFQRMIHGGISVHKLIQSF